MMASPCARVPAAAPGAPSWRRRADRGSSSGPTWRRRSGPAVRRSGPGGAPACATAPGIGPAPRPAGLTAALSLPGSGRQWAQFSGARWARPGFRPQCARLSGACRPFSGPGGRPAMILAWSSRAPDPRGISPAGATRRSPPRFVPGPYQGARASLLSRASAARISRGQYPEGRGWRVQGGARPAAGAAGSVACCRQRCPGWPVRRILRIPADTGNSPENGFHPHFPARVLSFQRSFLILGRKIRSFLAKPRRTLTAEPEIFPVHPKFARQTSTENSFCRRFSRSLRGKLRRKTRFWGSSIKNFCILSIHVEKIVYIYDGKRISIERKRNGHAPLI